MPIECTEHDKQVCDNCGHDGVKRAFTLTQVEYNNGGEIVLIPVELPVYTCPNCDFEYLDGEAEEIKHEAICNHLKLLTPKQIENIREKYHLSKKEFSDLTGIGPASLSRWESGALLQSRAYDNYLRLVSEEVVMGQLHLISGSNRENSEPQFSYLRINTAVIHRSQNFQL